MSRAARLLDLLEILRRRRRPVSGAALAEELGIHIRTLYRDIATLQAQGACIEGEPGVGYVLQPGYTLPPLMFSEEEIHAVSLGAKWVMESADEELSGAAENVLAKIAAVMPESLRTRLSRSPFLVGPSSSRQGEKQRLRTVRTAIQNEHKISFTYTDGRGATTQRIVWPFSITFFEDARLVMAWCETRSALRHFRLDRMDILTELPDKYPRSRDELMAEWVNTMVERENFDPGWPY